MNITKITANNINFSKEMPRLNSKDNITKVENVLKDCLENPYEITFNDLCNKTGLSARTVGNIISRKFSIANKLWLQAQNISVQQIREANYERGIIDKKHMYPTAIAIMKDMLESGRKHISYAQLQKDTGLTKEQIDECIQEYVEYRNKQAQLNAHTKNLQKEWYLINKDKIITPYVDETID